MTKLSNMAAVLAVAAVTAFAGAGAMHAQATIGAGPADLQTMMAGYRRPDAIPAPADNPTTPAKVELGKALFFDPRLSGSGAISCASCHNPALGWEDGLDKGVGHAGARLGRHTPTILNAAWIEPLFWDGRAGTLEEQAKGPLQAPAEMNMPHGDVVRVVSSIPGYGPKFARAFPNEEITIDTIAKAIAAYERTVVSGKAPFDLWLEGDEGAVSDAAKRGFVVYNTTARCNVCHGGWRMTDDGFHDIGLPGDDLGRGKIAPELTILQRAFKTPTLRNINQRAPFMHDGSIRTLEEVVEHYDHGFVQRASLSPDMKPLKLTAQEKSDLVAFLNALTSRDPDVAVPVLPH